MARFEPMTFSFVGFEDNYQVTITLIKTCIASLYGALSHHVSPVFALISTLAPKIPFVLLFYHTFLNRCLLRILTFNLCSRIDRPV